MALNRFTRNLEKISVDIEETTDQSIYFNVFGIKDIYPKGLHVSTIRGSRRLKRGSYIYVEIKHENGRTIPIKVAPATTYEQTLLPLVRFTFDIADNVPEGNCTITFIGTTNDDRTIRFQKTFAVNKRLPSRELHDRGDWENEEFYEQGDLVTIGGVIYKSILSHEAGPDRKPTDGADWQTYWRVFTADGADVRIVFTKGNQFNLDEEGNPKVETLELIFVAQNFTPDAGNIQWINNETDVVIGTGEIFDLSFATYENERDQDEFLTIRLRVKDLDSDAYYEDLATIIAVEKGEKGDDGDPGEDAKVVKIISDSQVVRESEDQSGNVQTEPQQIILTPYLQNIDGNVTWKINGNETLPAGASVSDGILTIEEHVIETNILVELEADGITDTTRLFRIKEGSDAFTSFISPEQATIVADSDGVLVGDIETISTELFIFRGVNDILDLYDNIQTTLVQGTAGFNVTTPDDRYVVTMTSLETDTAVLKIEATDSAFPTITKFFRVTKQLQGERGLLGLSLLYRGIWDESVEYVRTNVSTDVVEILEFDENLNDYITKYFYLPEGVESSTDDNPLTSEPNPWAEFETFEAIATDILLAKDVTIRRTLTMGEPQPTASGGIIQSLGGFDNVGGIATDQEAIQTRFYRLDKDGIEAHKGKIGGVVLDNETLYIGGGNFNNVDTSFYVDGDGNFSLGDKFVWDDQQNLSIDANQLKITLDDLIIDSTVPKIVLGTDAGSIDVNNGVGFYVDGSGNFRLYEDGDNFIVKNNDGLSIASEAFTLSSDGILLTNDSFSFGAGKLSGDSSTVSIGNWEVQDNELRSSNENIKLISTGDGRIEVNSDFWDGDGSFRFGGDDGITYPYVENSETYVLIGSDVKIQGDITGATGIFSGDLNVAGSATIGNYPSGNFFRLDDNNISWSAQNASLNEDGNLIVGGGSIGNWNVEANKLFSLVEDGDNTRAIEFNSNVPSINMIIGDGQKEYNILTIQADAGIVSPVEDEDEFFEIEVQDEEVTQTLGQVVFFGDKEFQMIDFQEPNIGAKSENGIYYEINLSKDQGIDIFYYKVSIRASVDNTTWVNLKDHEGTNATLDGGHEIRGYVSAIGYDYVQVYIEFESFEEDQKINVDLIRFRQYVPLMSITERGMFMAVAPGVIIPFGGTGDGSVGTPVGSIVNWNQVVGKPFNTINNAHFDTDSQKLSIKDDRILELFGTETGSHLSYDSETGKFNYVQSILSTGTGLTGDDYDGTSAKSFSLDDAYVKGLFTASGNDLTYDDGDFGHATQGGTSISTELEERFVISKLVIDEWGHVTETNTREITDDDLDIQRGDLIRGGLLEITAGTGEDQLLGDDLTLEVHLEDLLVDDGIVFGSGSEYDGTTERTIKLDIPVIVAHGGTGVTSLNTGELLFGGATVQQSSNLTWTDANDGLLTVGGNTLFRKVNTLFDRIVSGEIDGGTDVLNNYVSGFAGSGLLMGVDVTLDDVPLGAYLELDNLTVRQTMRIYELLINQIRATNGSLWVSSAMKVEDIEEVEDTNGQQWKLYAPEDQFVPFLEGDLIRAQRFTGRDVYLFLAEVIDIENGNQDVTDNSIERYVKVELSAGSSEPVIGMDIVRYGNVNDPQRQGAVYLTSDDIGAPYIDIIDGVSSPQDFMSGDKNKVRLGNLVGAKALSDGTQPEGYGLRGENVYLEGAIVADRGRIGNTRITRSALISGNIHIINYQKDAYLTVQELLEQGYDVDEDLIAEYYLKYADVDPENTFGEIFTKEKIDGVYAWYLRDDGTFGFGGNQGIIYDGQNVKIGSDVLIEGTLDATGTITSGNVSIGDLGSDKFGLSIDNNNYWHINQGTTEFLLGGTNGISYIENDQLSIRENVVIDVNKFTLQAGGLSIAGDDTEATISLGTLESLDPNTTNLGVYATDDGNVLLKSGSVQNNDYLLFDGSGIQLRTGVDSSIGMGATAIGVGDGVWIKGDGSEFRIGKIDDSRFEWEGTNFEIYNDDNELIASFGDTNSIAGWEIEENRFSSIGGSGGILIEADPSRIVMTDGSENTIFNIQPDATQPASPIEGKTANLTNIVLDSENLEGNSSLYTQPDKNDTLVAKITVDPDGLTSGTFDVSILLKARKTNQDFSVIGNQYFAIDSNDAQEKEIIVNAGDFDEFRITAQVLTFVGVDINNVTISTSIEQFQPTFLINNEGFFSRVTDDIIIPLVGGGDIIVQGGGGSTTWLGLTGRPFTSLNLNHFSAPNNNVLSLVNPFDPTGTYAGLRAQATTKADVGLSNVNNVAQYSITEIDNFFDGTTAIDGYNKSNWDEAYNLRLTSDRVADETGVYFDTGSEGQYTDNKLNLRQIPTTALATPTFIFTTDVGGSISIGGTDPNGVATLGQTDPISLSVNTANVLVGADGTMISISNGSINFNPSLIYAEQDPPVPEEEQGDLNLQFVTGEPGLGSFSNQFNVSGTGVSVEVALASSVTDDIDKGVTAEGWGNHADANYVHESLTLTINGVGQTLQGNRSWSVGTVTSVSGGDGLAGTVTGAGAISLGEPSSITLASTNTVSDTTHTHAFTPGGNDDDFIRGDGELAALTTLVTTLGLITTTNRKIAGSNGILVNGTEEGKFLSDDLTISLASSISDDVALAKNNIITGVSLDELQGNEGGLGLLRFTRLGEEFADYTVDLDHSHTFAELSGQLDSNQIDEIPIDKLAENTIDILVGTGLDRSPEQATQLGQSITLSLDDDTVELLDILDDATDIGLQFLELERTAANVDLFVRVRRVNDEDVVELLDGTTFLSDLSVVTSDLAFKINETQKVITAAEEGVLEWTRADLIVGMDGPGLQITGDNRLDLTTAVYGDIQTGIDAYEVRITDIEFDENTNEIKLRRTGMDPEETLNAEIPVYTHPVGFSNKPATVLSGASVISQIHVTNEGHVDDVQTRNLSPADIGAAPSFDVGSVIGEGGINVTNGGSRLVGDAADLVISANFDGIFNDRDGNMLSWDSFNNKLNFAPGGDNTEYVTGEGNLATLSVTRAQISDATALGRNILASDRIEDSVNRYFRVDNENNVEYILASDLASDLGTVSEELVIKINETSRVLSSAVEEQGQFILAWTRSDITQNIAGDGLVIDGQTSQIKLSSATENSIQTGVNAWAARIQSIGWDPGNKLLTLVRDGNDLTKALTHTHDVSDISGTMTVPNGGTGQTSFGEGRLLYGNDSSPINTSENLTFVDNILSIKNGLVITSEGGTAFDVQGESGQLFSITDSLVGVLMSVNDISGLPILEVSDDDTVKMGSFGAEGLIVSGSEVIFPNITNDVGNFITISAVGIIHERTPQEVLNDIDAEPAFEKGDINEGDRITIEGNTDDRLVGSGDITINVVLESLSLGTGLIFEEGSSYDGSVERTIKLNTPVIVEHGGTGRTSITTGNLLFGNDTNAIDHSDNLKFEDNKLSLIGELQFSDSEHRIRQGDSPFYTGTGIVIGDDTSSGLLSDDSASLFFRTEESQGQLRIEGRSTTVFHNVKRDSLGGLAFSLMDVSSQDSSEANPTRLARFGMRGSHPELEMIGIQTTGLSSGTWYNRFNFAVSKSGSTIINPDGLDIRGQAQNNSLEALYVFGIIRSSDGYKVGTTTVIDSDRDVDVRDIDARDGDYSGDLYVGGNVGIGTTDPNDPLHIKGDWGQIRMERDGVREWRFGISSDGRLNIYDQGAGNSPFRIEAGTPDSTLYLRDTGNVGIGTSNPNTKLHVFEDHADETKSLIENPSSLDGAIASHVVAGDEGEIGIIVFGSGFSGDLIGVPRSNAGWIMSPSGAPLDSLGMVTRTNIPLYFATDSEIRMTISGTGDISVHKDLEVLGDTDLQGEVDLRDIVRVHELIRSAETFNHGFNGSGFLLSTDYEENNVNLGNYLEVDNLTVRQRMVIYELLVNQIRATNGSIFVSSSAKIEEVEDLGNDTWKLSLTEDDSDGLIVPFVEGDLIRAQRFTGTGTYFFVGEVVYVDNENAIKSFNVTLHNTSDNPVAGMEVVRFGSTSDTSRQGSIYMSADDIGAPFIDIIDEVSSVEDWLSPAKNKARFGNLNNTPALSDGTQPFGYGIRAENVFLEGTIVADNGRIGGTKIDQSTLKSGNIWIINYQKDAYDVVQHLRDQNFNVDEDIIASYYASMSDLNEDNLFGEIFTKTKIGDYYAWYLRDDGSFGFGGKDGIIYDGEGEDIKIGSDVLIEGTLDATGKITSGEVSIGDLGDDKFGLSIDDDNYWYIDDGDAKFSLGGDDGIQFVQGSEITIGTNTSIVVDNFDLSAGELKIFGSGSNSYLKIGTLDGITTNNTNKGIYVNNDGNLLIKTGNVSDSNYLLFDNNGLTLRTGSTSSIGMGATGFTSGDGVWIKGDGTEFRVGNVDGSRFIWDNTDFKIFNSSENEVVTLGGTNQISGWTIETDKLSSGNIEIISGGDGRIEVGTDFWDGDGTFSFAGGNVTWDGDVLDIDGSGTFSGTITSSEGSIASWEIDDDEIKSLVNGSGIILASQSEDGAYIGLVNDGSEIFTIGLDKSATVPDEVIQGDVEFSLSPPTEIVESAEITGLNKNETLLADCTISFDGDHVQTYSINVTLQGKPESSPSWQFLTATGFDIENHDDITFALTTNAGSFEKFRLQLSVLYPAHQNPLFTTITINSTIKQYKPTYVINSDGFFSRIAPGIEIPITGGDVVIQGSGSANLPFQNVNSSHFSISSNILSLINPFDPSGYNNVNWDTAFAQTRQWDGGSTGLVASTARNSLDVPTRTGGDASGTWDINITGNAATVTNGVYTTGNQTITGRKDFRGNSPSTQFGDNEGLIRLAYPGDWSNESDQDHVALRIQTNQSNDSDFPYGVVGIRFATSTSPNWGPLIGATRVGGGNGDLVIKTGGNSIQERFRIRDNGNIGINASDASERLDINGKLRIRTVDSGLGNEDFLTINSTGVLAKRTPEQTRVDIGAEASFQKGSVTGSSGITVTNGVSRLVGDDTLDISVNLDGLLNNVDGHMLQWDGNKLNFSPGGDVTEYVRGDGQLATLEVSPTQIDGSTVLGRNILVSSRGGGSENRYMEITSTNVVQYIDATTFASNLGLVTSDLAFKINETQKLISAAEEGVLEWTRADLVSGMDGTGLDLEDGASRLRIESDVLNDIATGVSGYEARIQSVNWTAATKQLMLERDGGNLTATLTHTHDAGDINSGTISYDRLPISSTQVSNWDTAYGWGDFRTFGLGVTSGPALNPQTVSNTAVQSGIYGGANNTEVIFVGQDTNNRAVYLRIERQETDNVKAFLRNSWGNSWNTEREIVHSGNVSDIVRPLFNVQGDLMYASASGTFTYSHPTGFSNQPATELSGASVISRVNVNNQGHVTGVSTRNLTPANIGAESAFTKGGLTQGSGMNLSGTLTNRLVGTGNVTIAVDGTVMRNNARQTIETTSSTSEALLSLNATNNAGSNSTLLYGQIASNTTDMFFMDFRGTGGVINWRVSTDGVLRAGDIPWSMISSIPDSATRGEISEANITNTTSSTIGFITGRRMHHALTNSDILVRTSGNQSIGGIKTFTDDLNLDGNLKLDNILLSNQENLNTNSGALRLIAQISASTYDATFFDYVIKKGSNLRTGTIYAVHDGTNVEFTETSTNDLGDTKEVVLTVDISGGNIRLMAETDTDGWQIKSLIRGL